MTRWLVTGATGMLGTDLSSQIAAAGELVVPLSRKDLDITDAAAIKEAVEGAKPDVIVNCAAWTAVDDAQEHEEAALAVNGHAVASLAAACASVGAVLVQVSTDYVFDGLATSPYAEDAAPAPRTAYGRTKLAGERALLAALPDAAYVVRTAWLYGAHGPNFVRTMIRLAAAGISPAVVDDQRGQPTWSLDVAGQIRALIGAAAPPGIYHATSSGETTWYGLASEIFSLFAAARAGSATGPPAGSDCPAPVPTTSAAYRRPAPRPGCSVLSHAAWAAAGIAPIGDWRDALHRAFPAVLATSRDRPGPTQRRTSSLVLEVENTRGVPELPAWIVAPSSALNWPPHPLLRCSTSTVQWDVLNRIFTSHAMGWGANPLRGRHRPGGGEDLVDHAASDSSGEGVLLAGVITAEQHQR